MDQLIPILLLLRNGATVTGDDSCTATYRETCLEQSYLLMCQDLIPALAALCVLPEDDQRLSNLIDVSSMMQKKIITRSDGQYCHPILVDVTPFTSGSSKIFAKNTRMPHCSRSGPGDV